MGKPQVSFCAACDAARRTTTQEPFHEGAGRSSASWGATDGHACPRWRHRSGTSASRSSVRTSALLEALECAVLVGVVANSVLPAAPDDVPVRTFDANLTHASTSDF